MLAGSIYSLTTGTQDWPFAAALFTSQSGVSKHIKDLEDELGVELFQRRGKRLLGLTEPGKEVAQVADRMLQDLRQ